MSERNRNRIKLEGGPEKTATSVEILADGRLVVELYDFSEAAEQTFGNDIALTLTISAFAKVNMLSHLLDERGVAAEAGEDDELLLHLIAERFRDYYELQSWFQDHEIPYRKEFDPWA